MKLLVAIGSTLRAARVEAGISQERLAEKAGVYRNTVGLIERGEMSVSLQTYAQICDALGYRSSQLLVKAEQLVEAAEAQGQPKADRWVATTKVAARAVGTKQSATAKAQVKVDAKSQGTGLSKRSSAKPAPRKS
ncbi:MAG: helix-turn-helix domain-containing protein [Hyphomicrobiales bacterium]|nr:MAG: helix-turn-helix domain-containing protein [Hyphomicrobiales bacterium]